MERIRKLEKQIVLALLLALVVFSLLAFWGDFEETIGEIVGFNWKIAPLLLVLSSGNYLLRFGRWQLFLKKAGFGKKITTGASLLVFLAGLPLTLTPGKTGEIVKAYFLKRVSKGSFSKAAPIVVAERLADGLAALVLLSFGLIFWPFGWLPFAVAALMCGLFILFFYNNWLWKRLFGWLCESGLEKRTWGDKFLTGLGKFRKVLLKLISWRVLLTAVFLAGSAWFLEALGLSLIISEIGGIAWGTEILFKAVFSFCLVSILGFVSFLPGGLGIAEGSLAGMMIFLVGMSNSQAVAVALLLRIFTLWWGVTIGMMAFSLMLRKIDK